MESFVASFYHLIFIWISLIDALNQTNFALSIIGYLILSQIYSVVAQVCDC